MEVELAQRVRRVVYIPQRSSRAHAFRAFIQRRGDRIVHPLLPVPDSVAGRRRRKPRTDDSLLQGGQQGHC